MKKGKKTKSSLTLIATLAALICVAAWPGSAGAQSGYNAVYQGSSTISSSSFIDASAFLSSTVTDVCQAIFAALSYSSYPTVGRVIDARGLNKGNTSMTCASDTPWVNGALSITNPADILLPPGTIVIGIPWVLPDQTRIFGEGRGKTSIVAGNGLNGQPSFSGTTMIQMCSGISLCFGVAVADVMLNGQGQTMDGIDNFNSEEQSFVAHVSFTSIEGVGLNLGTASGGPSNGTSNHSGPYLDIEFGAGGKGTCPNGPPSGGCPGLTTACVQIINAQPRGIHGITCTANGYPNAAILLDGQNVSIEDVHIEGFKNGILMGDQAATAANVITNVSAADGGSTSGPVGNIIHICKPGSPVSPCTSGSWSVVDLSLQAIAAYTINGDTIEDDLTSTNLTDSTVAFYAIGEPVGGGFSRFTTSPNTATWGFGSSAPTGSCKTGAVFSNSSGSPNTLYVCQSGSWVGK